MSKRRLCKGIKKKRENKNTIEMSAGPSKRCNQLRLPEKVIGKWWNNTIQAKQLDCQSCK